MIQPEGPVRVCRLAIQERDKFVNTFSIPEMCPMSKVQSTLYQQEAEDDDRFRPSMSARGRILCKDMQKCGESGEASSQ